MSCEADSYSKNSKVFKKFQKAVSQKLRVVTFSKLFEDLISSGNPPTPLSTTTPEKK